ncbi:MAG: hypothetical protein R2879_09705 [Saprospiraceae bacterium]
MVIRPANQGSSIGVAILEDSKNMDAFEKSINRAFFKEKITADYWNGLSEEEKVSYLRNLTDIRDGLGFPLNVKGETIYHPEALLSFLNNHFKKTVIPLY